MTDILGSSLPIEIPDSSSLAEIPGSIPMNRGW